MRAKAFMAILSFSLLTILLSACGDPMGEYNTTGTSKYSPEELEARQAQTIKLIIRLASHVEQYIIDHPGIGAPKADDAAQLITVLADAGYQVSEIDPVDAFGNQLAYRHHFSTHPLNRRDYDLVSLGEDGVYDLWKVTDHIRDTLYGQDIVWRHQSAVNDRSGFTHGPSIIRRQFAEHIAPPPGDVKMEY